MVQRVTTAQRFSVALRNIQAGVNRVQDVQEQIVTGKRITRPSDDPGGFTSATNLRRMIADSTRFQNNMQNSEGVLNVTDQTLSSIRSLVQEAQTIAISQAGAPSDDVTREASAAQIERIRDSILELANTQVGGRYIFSGTSIFTKAFDENGMFQGNTEQLDINIGLGNSTGTNVTAADFLTTDLNPDLYRVSSSVRSTAGVTDHFEIDATNNVLRVKTIPSGVTSSVTLTPGSYTGDELAAELQARFPTGVPGAVFQVSYDEDTDRFGIELTGGNETDFQILSQGTDPLSTAAQVFGFRTDSALGAQTSSISGTAFNIVSGTNDVIDLKVDGGTQKAVTLLADMAAPTAGLATAELNDASGVLVAGREYAYVVSAVDVTGESIHSAPVTRTVTGANNAIDFSFDRVPGAVAYRIYRLDDTEYGATGTPVLESSDFEQQDSLIGTVVDDGSASYTFLDLGQAQAVGESALAVPTGVRAFTGAGLADLMQLRINNEFKEVTADNNTIRILEDNGAVADTITLTTGTKSGVQLASELQTALNNSTVLTGSTSFTPPGSGYQVSYDAVSDKFTITAAAPATNVGVDADGGNLASLMGFSTDSPFSSSVTSDSSSTGAKVDYGVSYKDAFTITSPTLGAGSSIVLSNANGFSALNLNGAIAASQNSTSLSDLNGGNGVAAGSILITNRAGQTFTVDLGSAGDLDDVFNQIESTVTGVKASISEDGKRIVLTDTNSRQVSNLIVSDIGQGTTALDLGIRANVPGNITGTDLDPAVTNNTLLSALRDGEGISLGTVQVAALSGSQQVDLDLGDSLRVGDILNALNTLPGVTAQASISSNGKNLELASTDPNKSALLTDVSGTTARDLGFQGVNNLIGLLSTLAEALHRGDTEVIQNSLDVFSSGLERIGTQQVKIGQITRQFNRFKDQQQEINLSFTEVLSKIEDVDMVEALTQFSVFQNALQAAMASSAQILQVQLLDFLH